MSDYQHLTITPGPKHVATVTLDRPDVRNAFNEALIGEITRAMKALSEDDAIRVIVLAGAGKAFSAGADLTMMQRIAGYSKAENRQEGLHLADMLAAIFDCPKPTVALVNGPAIGGGVGLAAACDIVIAAESAFFALSEVRLGLIPAAISPYVVRAMGERQADRYFLTSERFTASEAKAMGFVHHAVGDDALGETLEKTVASLLKGGPSAQAQAKSLIRRLQNAPIDRALIEDTAERIAAARASAEGQEGLAAFLEKRQPAWTEGLD
ncbi:MAG: enoyl-CoA hydratase/isomerase family protein [Pseudomonadota bacterium]